jgi:hypothetical protein
MIAELKGGFDEPGGNTVRRDNKRKTTDIARKCFLSLEKFKRTPEGKDKLKEATLSIIANFLFQDKSILLNIFRIMDESGDGQLGIEEL